MKFLGKYWKVLIALALLIGAAVFFVQVYMPAEDAYEAETAQIQTMISVLQNKIAEDMKYADIQDDLDEAKAEISASRLDLYQHFPVELKEEDQIEYTLYLETLFGTEIFFEFGQALPITVDAEGNDLLHDGSTLRAVLLTVNYHTDYDGFQEMVDFIARDDRIVSVYEATIKYYKKQDIAKGTLTLLLYVMDSEDLRYFTPNIATPETGKENLYR